MTCRSTLWALEALARLGGEELAQPVVSMLTAEETIALGDWLSRVSPPYDNEPVRSAIRKLSVAADTLRGHI